MTMATQSRRNRKRLAIVWGTTRSEGFTGDGVCARVSSASSFRASDLAAAFDFEVVIPDRSKYWTDRIFATWRASNPNDNGLGFRSRFEGKRNSLPVVVPRRRRHRIAQSRSAGSIDYFYHR